MRSLQLLAIAYVAAAADEKVSCAGVSQYGSSVSYSSGDRVVFESVLWRAKWYTTNAPSADDSAWLRVGECDQPISLPECTGNLWDPQAVYATPTEVDYASVMYRSKWWISGGAAPSPSNNDWQYLGPCVAPGSDANDKTTIAHTTSSSLNPRSTTEAPGTPTTSPRPTTTRVTSPALPVESESTATTTESTLSTTRSAEPSTTFTSSTRLTEGVRTSTTASNEVRPNGPVGPNNECVWPYVVGDYAGGTYVGVEDKVYKNKYWAGAADMPGVAAVWELVASCSGTAPKAQYTDAEMLSMLDPNDDGIQVIKDPWTPLLPTSDEMAAAEAAVVSLDPLIPLLKQAGRVLHHTEIEAIVPLRAANPDNVKRVESILSESDFDRLLPVRHTSYTYVHFLKGIGAFPDYCKTYDDGRDSDAICRKFLAVSFAHNVQETGANSPSLRYGQVDSEHTNVGADKHYKNGELVPLWKQALWFLREIGHTEQDTSSAYEKCGFDGGADMLWALNYPCAAGRTYFGRGSKQLSWNYNYGACSQQMFGDSNYLLEHPELVADTWLNFGTAIWFAVTPQSPKPPMTWVIDGTWSPNSADTQAGLSPGFGATIMVINGGIECGGKAPASVSNRVSAYKHWAEELKVPIPSSEDLDCSKATAFPANSAAATKTYWSRSWSKIACELVTYQTPWQVQNEGDYARCVDFYFRSHFFKNGNKISDYGDAPKEFN